VDTDDTVNLRLIHVAQGVCHLKCNDQTGLEDEAMALDEKHEALSWIPAEALVLYETLLV